MNNINFPTGRFPPHGYNDNNFGRQKIVSNIHPSQGGQKGNPFGNYNPLSTNEQHLLNRHYNQTDFNRSYKRHDPIIERMNYANQRDILHDNVGDIVLDEHIQEYRINIDSLDRDITVYPNPFNYTVKFNPPGKSLVRTLELIDPTNPSLGKKIVQTPFPGPPKPHINKEFRNVKYIKLDTIVLPQFSNIIEDPQNIGSYIFDPDSNLLDDRYVNLHIKELDNKTVFSTNEGSVYTDINGETYKPKQPYGIIFPDKVLGDVYYVGTPYHSSRIYKNSLLNNIGSLTIELIDSCGKPLSYDNLGIVDENDDPIPLDDIRNPFNKKIQNHLSFIIGVVESQVNTNTKFEN